jgi:hypothetical protein
MPECLNGQIPFKLKDKRKKKKEFKNLKMMKSKEDKSTPRKKLINKN